MSSQRGIVRRTDRYALPFARAAAEGHMQAIVRITRESRPAFNVDTGNLEMLSSQMVWGPESYTERSIPGSARVYSVTGPVTMDLGDEPQYFSTTYVSIPLESTPPNVDDLVTVLAHDDPKLVGRTFRVQDVEAGGQFPIVYRMQVTGLQPGRTWRET